MIDIRKASENDLLTIHDMAQVVFRHTYRDILSSEQMEYMMDMMYSLPNLRKQLEEGHHYYIAYDAATPCGYVSVQYEGPDADGIEVFHLHKIYVMPQVQGRGVGLHLFRTAVQHVRAALQPRANESVTAIGKTAGATTIGKTESSTAIGRPALALSAPVQTTSLSALAPSAPCPAKARIELNVNKFNSAVNFYKHLGMRILLEEDFPIGNGFYKTDYIMGRDV